MLILIYVHVITGLLGIVAGLISVAGMFKRKRLAFFNAIFLTNTFISCATGFAFLPLYGLTSAQFVAFFLLFLLSLAVYSRYVRKLIGHWLQVYAITATGSLYLNILIAIAQSFLHLHALKTIAPTQESPIYIAVKVSTLVLFILFTILIARRTDSP